MSSQRGRHSFADPLRACHHDKNRGDLLRGHGIGDCNKERIGLRPAPPPIVGCRAGRWLAEVWRCVETAGRLVAMEPAQAPRCPPAGRWAWVRGTSPTNGPTGALVAEWPSTAHSTPSLSALLAKCLALSTVGLSARRLFLPRETDSTNLRLARPMGSRSYLESGPSISTRSAKSRRRRTSAQGACTYRSTSFVTGRHEFPSSVNT
jgi:hypothetical protein